MSIKGGKRYAESAYQEISIADGCNHVSTIVHEMMHAIGYEFFSRVFKGAVSSLGSVYVSRKLPTYFSFRAKCWLGGGVGGQFPRNG